MYKKINNLLPLFALIMFSCNPMSDCCMSGPCVHEFREPVLIIESAEDAENQPIDAVILSDITFNGNEISLQYLMTLMTENIQVEDDRATCTIPCGFGIEDGTYAFTAWSTDTEPKDFNVEATYGSGTGGCPSFSDDGTRLSLSF